MRVIAISGGSCTGKTTVIEAIKKRGYMVDDLKAARTVMANLNITVDDLQNANESLVIRYQEELLKVKSARDATYANNPYIDFDGKYVRDDIVFVERSLTDLYGFSCMWHTYTDTYSEWLEDYRNRIAMAQSVIYDHVCVLPFGKFEYAKDGVRVDTNSNRLAGLDAIVTIETFAHSRRASIIQSVDVEARVDEILQDIQ